MIVSAIKSLQKEIRRLLIIKGAGKTPKWFSSLSGHDEIHQVINIGKGIIVAQKPFPMVNYACSLIAFKTVQQFFLAVKPCELRKSARPNFRQHTFFTRNRFAFVAMRQPVLHGAFSVFASVAVGAGRGVASIARRIFGTEAACKATPSNPQISSHKNSF